MNINLPEKNPPPRIQALYYNARCVYDIIIYPPPSPHAHGKCEINFLHTWFQKCHFPARKLHLYIIIIIIILFHKLNGNVRFKNP